MLRHLPNLANRVLLNLENRDPPNPARVAVTTTPATACPYQMLLRTLTTMITIPLRRSSTAMMSTMITTMVDHPTLLEAANQERDRPNRPNHLESRARDQRVDQASLERADPVNLERVDPASLERVDQASLERVEVEVQKVSLPCFYLSHLCHLYIGSNSFSWVTHFNALSIPLSNFLCLLTIITAGHYGDDHYDSYENY